MVRRKRSNGAARVALALLLGMGSLGATDVPPAFECLRPTSPPLLPDGTFATHYQMERARDAVSQFNTALRDYRACLQHKLDTAPASIAAARKQDLLAGIGASLTEERSLDQDFRDQLEKFRMR